MKRSFGYPYPLLPSTVHVVYEWLLTGIQLIKLVENKKSLKEIQWFLLRTFSADRIWSYQFNRINSWAAAAHY